MVLEAVMLVVDNSENSRNGDYTPTRWEAQKDAVTTVFNRITQSNPESSAGLVSMAGKGPEVLSTLTTELGKILDGIHRTKISGTANLATSIQIAGLALKHRQNKTQKQRIVVFTCSPIPEDEKTLIKLAKKMKKAGVNVDFVAFGELDDDITKKLQAFNDNIKSGDWSNLVVVPQGPGLLSDQLLHTPIVNPEQSAADGGDEGGAGGGEAFEFGIDPSIDPELALALRMSMEEEKARVEKQQKEAEEASKKEALPEIKEGDESTPLLDNSGEASGSKKDDKKDDDKDKMDTS